MTQMDESRKESIQEEARRTKAVAVEKYNAGDLVGAKEFAVKAHNLDTELGGLRCLNTILDVHMAYEKKINGEGNWYTVLSADPTEDLGTISVRYKNLVRNMIYDRDDSVGGVDETQKILVDAWRYLSKEKLEQAKARKLPPSRRSVSFNYVEPPLSASGPVNQSSSISAGESKRKGPLSTDHFHVHELTRIDNDAGIRHGSLELMPNMLGSDLVDKAPSMIKLRLKRSGSSSLDSKKYDAAKRVKINETKNTTHMVNEDEYNVVVMSVPDADFYNFDKDRTLASFGENQVWATYDDYGMPRWYALVHKVISQEPFELCISWLDGKKKGYTGSMKKWIDSGYYKTSGCFTIGKRNSSDSLNSFSHRVQWTIGEKGLVYIYPRKGNVWALYANWSPSWDISTSVEEMNKYDMVEVLQDFDEEKGVTVVPLVKVPGFKTVFRRHSNPRTYPKKELFRFSHQVAYQLLTSKECKNAPTDCLELDPASLTHELLKVLTEEDERIGINKEEEADLVSGNY
ncbi:hypothetical protein AtNW77_Chr5g0134791 [Arabidopsis thaliana]|uniref:DUF3444 domain-containing protein n=1 Tax=Arabidopsis thaliana TaxID=3702 RepID=A0A178UC58_ARATH|nr:hypothetical protein AXX17_AT5G48970 [Arabidopsis thaliana]